VDSTGAINDSFLPLIKNLDADEVESAMALVFSKAFKNLETGFGEMFLQQIVYFVLFMATTTFYYSNQNSRYAADQEVDSSLSVLGRRSKNDPFSPKSITMKPASAVTLGDRRDALGMMEIKVDFSNDAQCKVDKDRCVLVTAATARVLCQLLEPKSYEKIVLQFVIANSPYFGLFVTRLCRDGTPTVHYIPLLDAGGPIYSCRNSPALERSKMFVALAVILDDLCSLLDDDWMLIQKYERTFPWPFDGEPILSRSVVERKPSQKDGSVSVQTNDGPSQEDDAMATASCDGRFVALQCAFLHTLRFGDEIDEEEARKPPYFFIGTEAATRQAVFVKAWPFSKATLVDVQSEWALHNQAHAAGVSVARPLDPQVIQVHSSTTSSSYVIIVTEYIPRTRFDQSSDTFLAFAVSLIDTVHPMHSTALVLHCELSPANVIWNGERVVLIDFGHAQPMCKAYSDYGTKGFEAPELSEGKPHAPYRRLFGGPDYSILVGEVWNKQSERW
jgi:Protein kinase domain